MTSRLYRSTHQCSTCPWRREVDPANLGGDFGHVDVVKMAEKARAAEHGSIGSVDGMACHRSPDDDPFACVGYLDNQLGVGNNIGLRMLAIRGDFKPSDLVVDGPQRVSMEEIIAETKARRRRCG